MKTELMVLIVSAVASAFFTLFIRNVLRSAGIGDKPIVTEHSHKAGTPTMGGLGMLMGLLLAAILYRGNQYLVITAFIMLTAAIIGLLDDLLGLKVKEFQKIVRNVSKKPVEIGQLVLGPGEEARAATRKARSDLKALLSEGLVEVVGEAPIKNEVSEGEKILAQLMIALFLVISGTITELGGFYLGIAAVPFIIGGIVGAINAVNLIDGMDGMAAGIILIASASCAAFIGISGGSAGTVPFMVLAGISLGFLVFNRYPASIFMGDTGSFALGAGYATAVMLTDTVYFGVLALSVPIVSVIVSLLHRAGVIRLPVEPLHHTLHYRGMSEKKIVLLYWLITLCVCALGLYFHGAFPA
ncbi:glycosyltransferase family 4 protein [Methanothermobacter wolfeii]|uniref:Glycosyltransferase family 4 protein n=1 Tax=Methanothermobacter wolfeii TaxID=145261 RepID=A0A9E7RRJ6_METWO|nr:MULTISPECIES: glycosyltransferase family 4 protein [Methanothermobacter]UXH31044.1 glycosyltransferase family 4 protein [Methanothermobacter wolfeii]SCM57512.1 putative phospho-N-acetylmuramoyl-pentapeptide-transferase {ECO:0000255/HAMAP-Rule:MF_00038} [Methanothermobacter wolfeii]